MNFNFSKTEFEKDLEQNKNSILFKKISCDIITPVLACMKLQQEFQNNFLLLESAENGNNKGRYSVLAFMPDLVWKVEGENSFINSNFAKNSENFTKEEGSVLENLRKLIKKSQINNFEKYQLPAIAAGIFGYFGYDMIQFVEKINLNNLRDDLQIAKSIFIRPQIIIVFDSLFDEAIICAPAFNQDSFESLVEKINLSENILNKPFSLNKNSSDFAFDFKGNSSKEEYCQMVEKGKKYIIEGDIFQMLPSIRFTSNFPKEISAFNFYRALRSINPSPFLFYLKLENFALTGSSPEIMVSLKNNKVTIRPLAGTRKRGNSAREDLEIAKELLNDEKETAEHLMLIDLGRHDVGRVSKAGSVAVTEKMTIENYSHVMHISSNVEGILDEKYDALDALISGFPAGTVSGAPKIRAMEIIAEIEKDNRSFYAGCVGYFAANGEMETCITLRCALIKDEKIHLQAGAGVVFDSKPESEYEECLNKARALMRACDKIKEFN
jgi:anthranilate synthase component 1